MKTSWKEIMILLVLAMPLAMMSGMTQLFGYWIAAGLALFGALLVIIKEESGKTEFEKLMQEKLGRKK